MKLSFQLATLKQRKQTKQPEAKPGPQNGGTWTRLRWDWLALCLILGVGGTLAVFEFYIWKVPPELVGKWQVEEGPEYGGTFRFFRNGALAVHLKTKKTDFFLKGHVTVEDKTLRTTTQNPLTKLEETRASTIRELTAESLILEFENGEVLRLVRKK
jgi:hypothetical protein